MIGKVVTGKGFGHETAEDFYHQEVPMPTIWLDALRPLGEDLTLETHLKVNWINHVNSLRNEGGTVWASQDGEEFHLKLL